MARQRPEKGKLPLKTSCVCACASAVEEGRPQPTPPRLSLCMYLSLSTTTSKRPPPPPSTNIHLKACLCVPCSNPALIALIGFCMGDALTSPRCQEQKCRVGRVSSGSLGQPSSNPYKTHFQSNCNSQSPRRVSVQ